MDETTTVNLTGLAETMLWTLHNRASEALRSDAILRDPEAVRIYDSIDYDYEGCEPRLARVELYTRAPGCDGFAHDGEGEPRRQAGPYRGGVGPQDRG